MANSGWFRLRPGAALFFSCPRKPLSHQWFPPEPVHGSQHKAFYSLFIAPVDLGGLGRCIVSVFPRDLLVVSASDWEPLL